MDDTDDVFFIDKQKMEEKLERSRLAFQELWEQDPEKSWSVAWSGGKDSTGALKFLVENLNLVDPARHSISVVVADTRMENPNLEEYLYAQVAQFNDWTKAMAYNKINATIVSRPLNRSFFYLVLGKGYTLPSNASSRWCTHSLKIEPQYKFRKALSSVVTVTGLRQGESAHRDNILAQTFFSTHVLQNTTEFGSKIFAPLIEFTIAEVWAYLQEDLPWGSSEDVRNLYRDATGECGFANPRGATEITKACGARFGCWTCPPHCSGSKYRKDVRNTSLDGSINKMEKVAQTGIRRMGSFTA